MARGMSTVAQVGHTGGGRYPRFVLALILLLAGCTATGTGGEPATAAPTAAPWPDSYQINFCYGFGQLKDAISMMQTAYDKAQNFDLDGASTDANDAGNKAAEAASAFSDADVWSPAHSTIVYLKSSTDYVAKSANLLKLGLDAVDAGTIKAAVAYMDKATYQLGRANTTAQALTAKYGIPCS